ncbi:MAG TPA: class I SAM-dependent methyltransferase [Cytophagales bacterium]|nr:class I SAM-dependent methyltransferase [Cytophagales bacterium]
MSISIICPKSKVPLRQTNQGLTNDGTIIYPLRDGAYRIVEDNNYTRNFGIEWNTFQKTQIDKFNAYPISYHRFFGCTKWEGTLEGENILEVGSGAGRFTQVVLDHTLSNLYSVDYSNAVVANYKNNGPHDRLHLFQASIYDLPFAKHQFDKVFCFGVLQHTPDVKRSIQSLCEMVKPGGELVVDFYPIKGWYSKINAKYLLRPFTKNMEHQKLLGLIKNNIDWLIKLYCFNRKIGLGVLNRFLPICDIDTTFPKGLENIKEWAILDTFDMFSPTYDNPQRLRTVERWFEENGMKEVKAEMIEYDKGLFCATVRGRNSAL